MSVENTGETSIGCEPWYMGECAKISTLPKRPENTAPYIETIPDCIIVRKGRATPEEKWYTEVECCECGSILITRYVTREHYDNISHDIISFWCVVCNKYQTITSNMIKKYNPMILRSPSHRDICVVC